MKASCSEAAGDERPEIEIDEAQGHVEQDEQRDGADAAGNRDCDRFERVGERTARALVRLG